MRVLEVKTLHIRMPFSTMTKESQDTHDGNFQNQVRHLAPRKPGSDEVQDGAEAPSQSFA